MIHPSVCNAELAKRIIASGGTTGAPEHYDARCGSYKSTMDAWRAAAGMPASPPPGTKQPFTVRRSG